MRPEDFGDYFRIRRFAHDPWRVLRFRKRGRQGDSLHVRLRSGGELQIRGGRADFHMFHRIFLRDEYRLRPLGRLGWVVDVGGNVGMFAARAAALAERVVSYEPFRDNWEQLVRNTAAFPNVQAVCAAVAGRAGRLRLYHPQGPGQSGVYSTFDVVGGHAMSPHYDEVEAVCLDDVYSHHGIERCSLLKLDVEGAEYDILHGASDAALKRTDRIHGEYHDVAPDDPRTRIDALRAFLAERGFAVEILPHRRKPNHGAFFALRRA